MRFPNLVSLSSLAVRNFATGIVLLAGLTGCSTEPDPTTGTVRVVAETGGLGLDLDGYTVQLGQNSPQALSANGTIEFTDVAPGLHQLQLTGIADNCALAPAELSAAVVVGQTTVVDLSLQCHIDLRGRLVIMSGGYGGVHLVAMRPDGSGRYILFEDGHSNNAPSILPDGSAVIYNSTRDNVWRLFRFETATGSISPLPPVGAMQFQPVVSPDGTEIAFEVMTVDANSNEAFQIWVMGANGENPRPLVTYGPADPPDVAPAWSPDGQWIVFSRNGDLQRVHPDGTMLTTIPCSPWPCNHPSWSPDGGSIAYTAQSDDSGDGIGENYDIYVMNLGSGATQRLTTSPDQESSPRWSPDGSAIAYNRVLGEEIHVFRMQADGSGAVDLTTQPTTEASPSWGPLP